MDILYNIIMVAALLIGSPFFAFRLIREKRFRERFRHNLAMFEEEKVKALQDRRPIWFQAASVGEVVAASSIIKECKRQAPHIPVILSSGTTSGVEMAERILPEADAIIFYPSDLPWLPGRVVDRINPRAFIPVETELWPNFIRAARHRGIPVIMVNGRIGEKNLHRYRQMRRLFTNMLDTVELFCMQSIINAQYIIQLGADPRRVIVTGNTKYDQNYAEVSTQEQEEMRLNYGFASDAMVLVAGSTHRGEEEIVLESMRELRKQVANCRLILAPRDNTRAERLREQIKQQGWTVEFSSTFKGMQKQEMAPDIIILDTIGELGRLYSVADIVFVGGSLIPHGGHNILEPAAHGKPILVGPHMFNFKDIYAVFTIRDACITIFDGAGLSTALVNLAVDSRLRQKMGAEAAAIVQENKGAAFRTAELLQQAFSERGILH